MIYSMLNLVTVWSFPVMRCVIVNGALLCPWPL